MTNSKDTHIGIIERFQSWNRRLFRISPSPTLETAALDFLPTCIDVGGLTAVVFVSGGYGKQKEEPMMQNEQLAQTPDTLDLVERARYAIKCDDAKHESGIRLRGLLYRVLHRNPPTLSGEIPLYGKFMEGLAFMRIMTSSDSGSKDLNRHVDGIWRDTFLRRLNEQKPVLTGPEGGRQLAWLQSSIGRPRTQCGKNSVRRRFNVRSMRQSIKTTTATSRTIQKGRCRLAGQRPFKGGRFKG